MRRRVKNWLGLAVTDEPDEELLLQSGFEGEEICGIWMLSYACEDGHDGPSDELSHAP